MGKTYDHQPKQTCRHISKATSARAVSKKKGQGQVPPGLGKIRIGIVHGKVFDPIKVGTHDRSYPTKLKIQNNIGPKASGWGGQFQVDVSVGLKLARLHPDIFDIDFMTLKDVSAKRFARNHLNYNFMGDASVALMEVGAALSRRILKVQKLPSSRHLPASPYYDWIMHKSSWMKQCMQARIPIIPTIFVDNGLDAHSILRQILAKGWEQFLIKPGYMSFFSQGILNGKTQDFVDDMEPLLQYAKEHISTQEFLVQPYVLKPDGNVFDEIRNFFIDGKWAYSVYTDGTDDDRIWEQPPGVLKEASKKLAMQAYAEVQKVSKWEGKSVNTLLTRIDVGVVPNKKRKLGYNLFVNEIECEISTWLPRYATIDVTDHVSRAMVKQTRELLGISLKKGCSMPNARKVKQLLKVLDKRLGPLYS